MGYICDFCGEQRSIVYCRSDAASLCLSCDRHVHSANALSKRHSRTLLCERCNSQPAFVRCIEEKISLCQNCDWTGHGGSTSTSSHKRETINCYSGCPSSEALSTMWPFVLDLPSTGNSTCEQGLSLMCLNETSEMNSWGPPGNSSRQDASLTVEVNDANNVDKSSILIGSSSVIELNSPSQKLDQPSGSADLTLPKLLCPGTDDLGFCEDDSLYEDFNMDEVDLNLENYEELFGVALSHSEQLFENGGIDSLFGNMDTSGADSHCQGAVIAEGSVRLANAVQPTYSNAASADSIMSSKTEPILCFTGKQAHSSLSFSGLTGESSAGDYQDCGASPTFLMGEPPWCPPGPESSLPSTSRSSAVMRYREKKKNRKFDKRVRYASRKARADVRQRVKGRFVKAGEAYDYDPISETRSF